MIGEDKAQRKEDLRKLNILLEYDTFTEWEKEAFPDMFQRVKEGKALTDAQRQKIDEAWERLDMGASKNLWSSGKIPMGNPVRLPYEDMPRPLKPPGK